jgi:hypothetical protein
MVRMIQIHIEIKLNLPIHIYIYVRYKIRKFYYLPNYTITQLNNFSLWNGFKLNLN